MSPKIATEHFLSYTEGTPGGLYCIAQGGYPIPTFNLQVGSRIIWDAKTAVRVTRLGNVTGMKVLYHTTFYWVANFVATPQNDGEVVRCSVSISGKHVSQIERNISVLYAPLIRCDDYEPTAYLNDKNVFITCHIKSKPALNELYWVVDDLGTKVHETKPHDVFWVLIEVR
ncbi:hypothetical protein HELRODRAFT_160468 [Helobdella robusta]|uniref:Ig-like domain-containing protein n=1 Tax=Helobdella robusta TaxID=6412 RepID=T1EQA4_HELRO|nr:hypothetical protein HELRODRAFT_160468 [Helobdella robusta]ESO06304.1 hypothetical protein HELRODRAFT_160468 [Helobdella robusta]